MKANLTTEQHWRILAFMSQREAAQNAFVAAREAAAHLHSRLSQAQKDADATRTASEQAKMAFSIEFARLATEMGATGDPTTWKVHVDNDPENSSVEWDEPPT